MKFLPGQSVIILDTENKPAGNAVVIHYHPDRKRYLVAFTYPGNSESEEIMIPEERIITLSKELIAETKKSKRK
ncbi:MAG: hypothetical protein V4539_04140 [Bacteroidota bacterium]